MCRFVKNLTISLIVLTLLACSSGKLSETLNSEQQAQWDWIKETKTVLDQKRDELAQLSEQIQNLPTAEVVEGEEAPTMEQLVAQQEELTKSIKTLQNDFQSKLTDFLYAMDTEIFKIKKDNPNVNKRPEHIQANALMSDEDILAAQDWITKQGDYRQALEHMEGVLKADPENQKVIDFVEKIKVDRWMTQDKMALLTRGMTEDEVRNQIGQVYRQNIQTWEDQGTMAWFFPREDSGIAGVYFIKGKDDRFTVFKINYDAKKPKGEEQEEEEATP